MAPGQPQPFAGPGDQLLGIPQQLRTEPVRAGPRGPDLDQPGQRGQPAGQVTVTPAHPGRGGPTEGHRAASSESAACCRFSEVAPSSSPAALMTAAKRIFSSSKSSLIRSCRSSRAFVLMSRRCPAPKSEVSKCCGTAFTPPAAAPSPALYPSSPITSTALSESLSKEMIRAIDRLVTFFVCTRCSTWSCQPLTTSPDRVPRSGDDRPRAVAPPRGEPAAPALSPPLRAAVMSRPRSSPAPAVQGRTAPLSPPSAAGAVATRAANS